MHVALEPVGVLKLVQELHPGYRGWLSSHYSLDVFDTLKHLIDLLIDLDVVLGEWLWLLDGVRQFVMSTLPL